MPACVSCQMRPHDSIEIFYIVLRGASEGGGWAGAFNRIQSDPSRLNWQRYLSTLTLAIGKLETLLGLAEQ